MRVIIRKIILFEYFCNSLRLNFYAEIVLFFALIQNLSSLPTISPTSIVTYNPTAEVTYPKDWIRVSSHPIDSSASVSTNTVSNPSSFYGALLIACLLFFCVLALVTVAIVYLIYFLDREFCGLNKKENKRELELSQIDKVYPKVAEA